MECYQNLLDNDIQIAKHRLGLMYYYGKGVPVDYKKSASLFKEAIAYLKLKSTLPI
jgi:TPR repeat protein